MEALRGADTVGWCPQAYGAHHVRSVAQSEESCGSGGGKSTGGAGGAGGGRVEIKLTSATGECLINGIISANGQDGQADGAGGGSGGAIKVTCPILTGSGRVSAIGGNGRHGGGKSGGGGSGGRLRVSTRDQPSRTVNGNIAYSFDLNNQIVGYGRCLMPPPPPHLPT